MNQAKEKPLWVNSLDDVQIVSFQFLPPNEIRIEFSRQLRKDLAIKRMIVRPSLKYMVDFEMDPEGGHLWRITPRRVKDVSYPLEVVLPILTPELARHLDDWSTKKQAVDTKEQWLQRLHKEYLDSVEDQARWRLNKHPCGLTYGEIMEKDHGWYEINGYFIWRGTRLFGAKVIHGFQDHVITKNKSWNNDIRFFLDKGYNLTAAIRIQDELWMENFRIMIAALAGFYAATPSAGARPSLGALRRLQKTAKVTPRSLERAIKRAEKALELMVQSYDAYLEIKASFEHAKRQIEEKEVTRQVQKDVRELTDVFQKILANDADASPDK